MAQGTTGTGAVESTSIRDAVRGAMTEAVGEGDKALKTDAATGDVVVDDKEDKPDKSDKTDESTASDEETFEIDASAEEIGNALALFRSIADPKTRIGVLQQLAKQGGYDLGKPQQVEQLADDITAILRESLGDSYDLLAGDKLGKALEKVLESKVKKLTDPILERISNAEKLHYQQQSAAALNNLWSRHQVPEGQREKIAGQMMAKMKQLPPSTDTLADEYLDDIYHLVQRDTDRARTVKTTVKKIQQNAQDATRKGASGEGGDEKRIKTGSRLPSVKESVAAAFRNERLEE